MSLKFLHALYVYVGSMLMREIFRDFRFQGWVELLFYQCFHFMKSREKLNFFFHFKNFWNGLLHYLSLYLSGLTLSFYAGK